MSTYTTTLQTQLLHQPKTMPLAPNNVTAHTMQHISTMQQQQQQQAMPQGRSQPQMPAQQQQQQQQPSPPMSSPNDWVIPPNNNLLIDEGTSTVTKVMDGLFISGVDASQDSDFLTAHKITAIVNTSGLQCPDMLVGCGIRYLTFRWSNDDLGGFLSSTLQLNGSSGGSTMGGGLGQSQANVTNGFDLHGKVVNKIYKFVEYHRLRGDGVLIHSIDAHSRAPIACIAYLCKKLGWSCQKALEFLYVKQPTIQPSMLLYRQLQRCVQYCQMVADGENEAINEDPLQAINNPLQRWLPVAAPSQQQAANSLQELLSNTYINTFLHLTPAGQPAQCSHPRTVRWIDTEIPTASLIRIAGRGYNHLQLQVSNKRDSFEAPQSPQKRPPTPLTNKQQAMAASPQQPLRNITNLQHSVPSPQSTQRTIVSSYAVQQPPPPVPLRPPSVTIHQTIQTATIVATDYPSNGTAGTVSAASVRPTSASLNTGSQPQLQRVGSSTAANFSNASAPSPATAPLSAYLQQQPQSSNKPNTTLASTVSVSSMPTAMQMHEQPYQRPPSAQPQQPTQPQSPATGARTIASMLSGSVHTTAVGYGSGSAMRRPGSAASQPSVPVSATTAAVNSYFQRFGNATAATLPMGSIPAFAPPASVPLQQAGPLSNRVAVAPLQRPSSAAPVTGSAPQTSSAATPVVHKPQPPSLARKPSPANGGQRPATTLQRVPSFDRSQAPNSAMRPHPPAAAMTPPVVTGVGPSTLSSYLSVISAQSTPVTSADSSRRTSLTREQQMLMQQQQPQQAAAQPMIKRAPSPAPATSRSGNSSSRSAAPLTATNGLAAMSMSSTQPLSYRNFNDTFSSNQPLNTSGPVRLNTMLRPGTAQPAAAVPSSLTSIYSTLQKPLWASGGNGAVARSGSLKKKSKSSHTEPTSSRSSSHKKPSSAPVSSSNSGSRKKSSAPVPAPASTSSNRRTSLTKDAQRQKMADHVYRAYLT